MSIDDLADLFSTVPISKPVVRPGDEQVSFNGFVWTDMGIRVGTRRDGDFVIRELRKVADGNPMAEEIPEDPVGKRG